MVMVQRSADRLRELARADAEAEVRVLMSEAERQAAQGLITNVLRVERALEKCVVQPMPQKVYDAVVSFAFNVGTGNACSSTLVKLLNQRRWADACHQLPRWVYVKGVFNQGLDNRRAREMAWCLKGA